jgi:hypothetical protein
MVILACAAAMLAAEKSRGVVSGRDAAQTPASAG